MAKAAARIYDTDTGHGCWPTRPAVQGSPDVLVNNRPAHRANDMWSVHCCLNACHTGFLSSGSNSVFVNGRQQGRVNDPINCGGTVATGSQDVFIGDKGELPAMCCNGQSSLVPVPALTDPNTPTVGGIPLGQDGSKGGTIPYYGRPGGGGEVESGGGYVSSDTQHATGLNATIAPVNSNVSSQLGGLSARYESNGNPGAVGHDGTGGYSYGSYQIATKTGTMNNYLTFLQPYDPSAYSALQAAGGIAGATSGSSAFQMAWQNLATTDSNFVKSQHDFIQTTHYDVAAKNIKNQSGIDINTKSLAVQDVVWSTAVQGGPNTAVFKVLQNLPSNVSDSVIINKIYDERGAVNSNGSLKYFSKSSQNIQNSVKNRFVNERQQALAML